MVRAGEVAGTAGRSSQTRGVLYRKGRKNLLKDYCPVGERVPRDAWAFGLSS